MNKQQYSSMLLLALVAGLVGGVVSGQFFAGQSAIAEEEVPHEKVVKAERFLLVDKKGNLAPANKRRKDV